jgi:hypothetical protein
MSRQEVIVVVQLRLDANHREEFLRTLFDIVERSRIAPECLSYELFSRAEDDNTLVLFQMWGTREAFNQNWLYSDLPRINTNSHLLSAPIESWELLELPSEESMVAMPPKTSVNDFSQVSSPSARHD